MRQKRAILVTIAACAATSLAAAGILLLSLRRPLYDPSVATPLDPDMNAITIAFRPADTQLAFIGDSIVERWEYRPEIWRQFSEYEPANLGCGGDRIDNVLWRIDHGALDGIHPKVIVVLAGSNDVNGSDPPFYKHSNPSAIAIAQATEVLVHAIHSRQPQATIILMALLPRRGRMKQIRAVNTWVQSFLPGLNVRYLDIDPELLGSDGEINPRYSIDGNHLTNAGYQVWAAQLSPLLEGIFGH